MSVFLYITVVSQSAAACNDMYLTVAVLMVAQPGAGQYKFLHDYKQLARWPSHGASDHAAVCGIPCPKL